MESVKRIWNNNKDLLFIYLTLIVMIAINVARQKNFLTVDNLAVLSKQLSPYIFAAFSQSLIIFLGGINFAAGSLISLSTAMFATMLFSEQAGLWMALVVCVITATIGMVTGLIIMKFNFPPIIVTLATSYMWNGLALMFLSQPGGFIPKSLSGFLLSSLGPIPVQLILIIVVIAIFALIMRSTIGRAILAVGNNRAGAYASGINVFKIYVVTYGLSALLSAIAGLMLCVMTNSGDPTIGEPYTISSVTASVLGGVSLAGGKGKTAGILAGAIVVGMLVNVLFFLNITGYYTYIVQGIICFFAVIMNSLRAKKKDREVREGQWTATKTITQ